MRNITCLSCGGFVLAIQPNHVVSDELGLVQFLKATADMAKGSSFSPPWPMWKRELLNARKPPQITCALHHQYEDSGNHQSTTSMDMSDNNDTLHQSFFFGTKQMTAIFNHLPPPHLFHSSSTLNVICPFIYVACHIYQFCTNRCRTIALQIDPTETVRVTFMVDMQGKPGLNLPPGYYGNSSVSPTAISKAEMLCKNPLEYAVELVKKAKAHVTEKYIRSVTDFLVVGFGWGKPVYGGPVGGTSFSSPYALFRNDDGEHGIVVPICLPVAAMERFKVELWRTTMGTNGDSHVVEPIKISSML
ncbi:Methanol O-anthraniloyltransferase [Camellia lanceoleosa]|nr:Methanol O-anthraniloyltransferase [Camellia lanceoleosa]